MKKLISDCWPFLQLSWLLLVCVSCQATQVAVGLVPTPQVMLESCASQPLHALELEISQEGFPAWPLAERLLKERCGELGITLSEKDGNTMPDVRIILGINENSGQGHQEGYSIRMTKTDGGVLELAAKGRDNRGTFYAALRCIDFLGKDEAGNPFLTAVELDDWPAWKRRALATDTGMYGEANLLRMLDERFNTIAMQHRYPGWQAFDPNSNAPGLKYVDAFNLLDVFAGEYRLLDIMLLVHLYDTTSGNKPLDISSEEEIEALIGKCKAAAAKNVRHIMICVDDHTPMANGEYACLFPGEKKKFNKSIGLAQGYLMRRLKEAMAGEYPELELSIVVPPYSLVQHNCRDPKVKAYFSDLMKELPLDVPVVWTGPMILSQTITREDFEEFSALIPGHGLYLWDNSIWINFPCFHWDSVFYDGFENDSWKSLIFINFRNHAFKGESIFADTAGAYLWNPRNFDQAAAHRAAFERYTGRDFATMEKCVPLFKELIAVIKKNKTLAEVPQDALTKLGELQALVDQIGPDYVHSPMQGQLDLFNSILNAKLPSATIPFFFTHPCLDGILDEDIWREATEIILLRHDGTTPPEDDRVTLRLGCTRDALVIGALCRSPKPLEPRPALRERDDRVFETDDVLEFFLGNKDGSAYRHLALDFEGHFWDSPPEAGFANDWNPNWKFAIDRPDASSWTAEIVIPFEELWDGTNENNVKPIKDFVWRVNFCREHRKVTPSLQSWSPPGFHEQRVFGKLVFPAGSD